MKAESVVEARRDRRLVVYCAVWILSYFAAGLILKAMGPPAAEWSRLGVALVPLLPFVLFLVEFIGSIRKADELHQKEHEWE